MKIVTFRGTRYCGVTKNRKLQVTIERTARGQNITAGIYEPTRGWQTQNSIYIPVQVRSQFEAVFI